MNRRPVVAGAAALLFVALGTSICTVAAIRTSWGISAVLMRACTASRAGALGRRSLGYVPFVTRPIQRGEAMVTLDVALTPDPGHIGNVLLPDGKPATGASLALCTWTNEVTVERGKLRYIGHGRTLGKLVQSAADGSFRLPSEVDPWVLVIAHDGGYAEVTVDEFVKSSTVRLRPWGRVEGELVVNGKPIADQVIGLSAVHGHQEVNLYYGGEVTTNAAGRFTMERVPPARLFIQPWYKQGKYSHNLDPHGGRMSIAGGQTTRITLPRPGRPIVGRVSLPPDSGLPLADAVVELSISLRPGPFFVGLSAFEETEIQVASQESSVKPELEQAFQRKKIRANADGTFCIEGLPETEYLLQIYAYRKPAAPGTVPGPELARATRYVEVPPLADSKEPVDLGNLVLSAVETTPPRPLVAPTRESVRTSGSGKAHTPSGLPSEEAAGHRSGAAPMGKTCVAPTVECAAGDLLRLEERVRAAAQAVRSAVVAVRSPAMGPSWAGRYQPCASGVIVTAEGIVLSQWHVSHRKRSTDKADERTGVASSHGAGARTTVILHDGRECPAELLGANRTRDISLLRLLSPGPFPHVPIRPATQVRVGDWVLRFGHPLGYRRDRAAPVRLGRVISRTDEVFTSDCAGMGGDSGGPYFDLDGQLVGIGGVGYGGSMALIPQDPLLARRTDQSFLFSVTTSRFIDRVFDEMRRGEIRPRNSDERVRIHRELDAAEWLRTADWSQGPATLAQYRSITASARSSVVVVLNDGVGVALGTVVGGEGWVVTKASELPTKPTCRLPDGRVVAARVVGADPAFDLALLKVPANDLHPVPWGENFDPPVGTLLAAVGTQEQPFAVGVVSVPRRDLANWTRPTYTLPLRVAAARPAMFGTARPERPGPLGLWTVPSEYSITDVLGLAWAAGVRPGDLLQTVNGRRIRQDEDLIDVVKGRLSGDMVTVNIQRGTNGIDLRMPLGAEPEWGPSYNYRNDDFPTVFECAVPSFTNECGGPLVDLTGRAVGIAIARVGFHGGMAIPGDCVLRLLPEMQAGKLTRNWMPEEPPGK